MTNATLLSQQTGGIHVQHNSFKCGCNLLWLSNWLERWLRDSRKAQLVSHEHYLKNYQLLDQLTCSQPHKLVKPNRLESAIKLDFLKLLPGGFELSGQAPGSVESPANSTGQVISLFSLNADELKCSNSARSIGELVNALLTAITFIFCARLLVYRQCDHL